MEEMTCPKCSSSMADRPVGDVTVHQCTACHGLFLDRADLAALVEAENDWYRDRDSGPTTQPLPRITFFSPVAGPCGLRTSSTAKLSVNQSPTHSGALPSRS